MRRSTFQSCYWAYTFASIEGWISFWLRFSGCVIWCFGFCLGLDTANVLSVRAGYLANDGQWHREEEKGFNYTVHDCTLIILNA